MDPRIKELIEWTKTKLGLANYYLKTNRLERNVNIFGETEYSLSMEWFPNHVTVQEDDGSNPEGAAVIELNLQSRKIESAIFVMGKSYAENGITFTASSKTMEIIKWVEEETGLTYEKQFQIHKEEEGEVHFKGCIDGIPVSPAASIEVEYDPEGKLTFFAVHGLFPFKEIVKEETYSLSLEKQEHLAKQRVKLIKFPSFEQSKLFPVYAVEEIYVTNNRGKPMPIEIIADASSYLQIEETIYWDQPLKQSFNQKEVSWTEEISAEQAFAGEPSPDSIPIPEREQEKIVLAVKTLLRQQFPQDSGKWRLKTLHREKGHIHAILRPSKRDKLPFQRKLLLIIDAENLQPVNYIDNKPMLEILDEFQEDEKITVNKEEAFEKLKGLFELKPYYVYDFTQKQFVLCGKLDCDYGVRAANGEVIALDDL